MVKKKGVKNEVAIPSQIFEFDSAEVNHQIDLIFRRNVDAIFPSTGRKTSTKAIVQIVKDQLGPIIEKEIADAWTEGGVIQTELVKVFDQWHKTLGR